MIVILLFLGAVVFAVSMIFMHPSLKKKIWVTIGLLVTVGSIGAIIMNYNQYWGMKIVTTRQTLPLTSSVSGKKVLLYQGIGNGRERVYLYRNNPLEHGLKKTNPMKGTVQLNRHARVSRLVVTRRTRVYRSEEFRLLFSAGVDNHQFVSQNWQFDLPDGWQVRQK